MSRTPLLVTRLPKSPCRLLRRAAEKPRVLQFLGCPAPRLEAANLIDKVSDEVYASAVNNPVLKKLWQKIQLSF